MIEDVKKDHSFSNWSIPCKENDTGERSSSHLKTCFSNIGVRYIKTTSGHALGEVHTGSTALWLTVLFPLLCLLLPIVKYNLK